MLRQPTHPEQVILDASGTIASGGDAQWVEGTVKEMRGYLFIQSPSSNTATLWVNFNTPAVMDSPSIEMLPGAVLTFEGIFAPDSPISVISSVTGTKFTIKEA